MPVGVFRRGNYYYLRFSVNTKPRVAAFLMGSFTAFMKPIELKFCGSDYCAYLSLPPGKYLYRYVVDGEVVLDDGPVENGYNVLILNGGLPRHGAVGRFFNAIYEVFVDRFNCRRAGDLRDRLGGRLGDVRARLSYIRSMGFDAIYLTPIFKAMSYHGYDVVDYLHVDEGLGGDREFTKLVREAHGLGIKIILDLPIHHTGSEHPAFKMAMGNDPDYARWYYIYGDSYEIFPNAKKMPKLNVYFAGEWIKGVALHWLLRGVDAFRIDVGAGIPPWYLWDLRNFLRTPVIAEVWGDPFLWGHAVDGVMNYQVRDALVKFLSGELSAEEFVRVLKRQLRTLPRYFLRNSWLFLGTHDTPRAMTLLGDINRVKAGLVFIYTWIGTPMVYYGDEVCMEGGEDPDNRRCMDWGSNCRGLRDFIIELSRVRLNPRYVRAVGNSVIYGDEKREVMIRSDRGNVSFKIITK
ncbi:alpha-amylase family glycosyl hydrolase [Vulcanisaeta thermophila]|uniref:alpha-amylase family glycosyl hydrolase n=1 Tax=Vulcanisaeta thermophila TaxID=867917 RepID=UPI0008532B2B|nr:alpha-amylase family glycosyl hydrolase [Vulcanisaeta thermophila]